MMNQVKTQEVKIGRSQIIAEVEVSENLTMDSDSYDQLQLVAAVIVDFLCLPLCPSSNIAEEEAAAHLWRQLHIYIFSSYCFGTILAAISMTSITSNILCITPCERCPSQLCPCRR